MRDTIYRQDAIDALIEGFKRSPTMAIRAKDMIEQLPSVQPEQCEDAVSRKDAIRWVKTECNPYGKPTLDFESGKKVIEHLERMSAVTPKRKNGKWIKHLEWQADGECGYECDQCGMGSDVDYDFCM